MIVPTEANGRPKMLHIMTPRGMVNVDTATREELAEAVHVLHSDLCDVNRELTRRTDFLLSRFR